MEYSPPGSSVHGISQARHGSQLPFPTPGEPRHRSVSRFCGVWPGSHSRCFLQGKEKSSCFEIHQNTQCFNGTPLQYSRLENPMDGGAWWAAVHGVAKSRTRLSNFTFTFHFHALEKEMATHSSVLSWRIPGTGEPGGLPSLGSHRVRHDWSDLAAVAAAAVLKLFIANYVFNTEKKKGRHSWPHSIFISFF